MAKTKFQSFHFDIGNSSDPRPGLGLCARVTAPDKYTATQLLRNLIQDNSGDLKFYDDTTDDSSDRPVSGLEYLRFYLNVGCVLPSDIDEENDPDERVVESWQEDEPFVALDADLRQLKDEEAKKMKKTKAKSSRQNQRKR